MKRILVMLLAAAMLLALAACGLGPRSAALSQTPEPTEEASEPTSEPTPEPTPTPIVEQPDLSNAPEAIGEAQQAVLEQFILIDELVAPGTAGGSLRCATAAASLLDWAENAAVTEESVAAVVEFMAAKSVEGQAEFNEKLDAVDGMVLLLTGEDSASAEGLLSDAGMLENCGYPWTEKAVETVEALMQALGRRAG